MAAARGRVLELGVGTGLNLDCYPPPVEAVTGIDPNPGMLELAARQAERSPRPVELVPGRAESLPCADRSFDTVVSTATLCSVADPTAALAEAHRVLAPGGRLLFLEHGLADRLCIARWQRRLTPLQRRLGDGCHLDRDFAALFAASPFTIDQLEAAFDPRMPKLAGYSAAGPHCGAERRVGRVGVSAEGFSRKELRNRP